MAELTEQELIDSATSETQTEGLPEFADWSAAQKRPLAKIHSKYLKMSDDLKAMALEAKKDSDAIRKMARKIDDPDIRQAYNNVSDLLQATSTTLSTASLSGEGPNQVQYAARRSYDIRY